ncbi:MAG: hypothetical protein E7526_01955 [Ruminococcaceae bacterium]|nr:hypothetical protein [Oscillospiraceae bacterium]
MTFLEIEHKSRALREKIRNAKPELDIKGTTYYVSADGDDNNDGLSPETAWKSIDAVDNNSDKLNVGDAVLFRCGDIFRPLKLRRRGLLMKPGVTYSSFGEGAKPDLRAYNVDGTTLDWKYEGNNIYSITLDHQFDIGNIIFDGDKEWGYKLVKGQDENLTPQLDLEYYHDIVGYKLYLCSEKGNPKERWNTIDIGSLYNMFSASDECRPTGAVVDGIAFRYTGGFGIGFGTVDYPVSGGIYNYGFTDFTVRNCEFEWIGGSLQGDVTKSTIRFGNGFEIWGGCDNLKVYNCYFNQCYDAALTQQFNGCMSNDIPVTVTNCVFSGNLFENNTYDYEYFLTEFDENRKHKADTGFGFYDVVFENNICRKNGYGFGNQRPDRYTPSCLKSWAGHQNKSKNFVIRNNIFDRADYLLIQIAAAAGEKYLPTLDGNVYCQYEKKGWIHAINGKPASTFDRDTMKCPTANYAEENAITVKPTR